MFQLPGSTRRLIISITVAVLPCVVTLPVFATPATLRLPCESSPIPAYSPPDSQPNIEVWRDGQIPNPWKAPACSEWPSARPILLVALAASFRFSGGIDDLLDRIGSISKTRGVRYWSVTDKAWQVLIIDANALDGPETKTQRLDFSVAELRAGADLYYSQHDNRSSQPVIYRMRMRQSRPGLVVVETENITSIRSSLITPFASGALRSLLFLEALSPGVWGFYHVTWVGNGSLLFGSGEASFINRATAAFRHIAGIPTDQEPPRAR